MIINSPLPVPSQTDPAPARELSEKEQAKYDTVLAHFSNPDYVLPGADSPLTEQERMWLSYECILRYLRATKYVESEAINRLEGTLKWRRDYGIDSFITPEHVEPEAVTGKMFLFGYDTRGRPALYMCPSRQNTEESPRQIQFTFWFLECAINLMGPGVETVVLMIDYADKAKNPSFATARNVLNILQTHYPERLGAALIAHIPWLIHTFYKLITPFIDPQTRTKMAFNPVPDNLGLWRSTEARDQDQDGAKLFELDQLVRDGWSGSAEFTYVHHVYWPALVSMVQTRRDNMTRVWQELGGTIGIKEWDVKVAVHDNLTAPVAEAL